VTSNFVYDLLAADALEREQRDLRQLLSEPLNSTQGLA
jgi:hypothetical protein